MGKWTPRKSAGKRVAKDGKTKGKYPPGIPFYKLLVKASLRSWPDEDGWMLLTDKQAPSDYFTASKLAEQLTAESSDRIARPGLGVSMASVSLESCAAALAVLPASSADKKYAQTGIPAVKKLLEALRESLAVANMTNRECADACSASPHIEKVLKKLGKQDALKQQIKDFAPGRHQAPACMQVPWAASNPGGQPESLGQEDTGRAEAGQGRAEVRPQEDSGELCASRGVDQRCSLGSQGST